MYSTPLIALTAAALLCGGCASNREAGDLDPGNIDHVVAQAEGYGTKPEMLVTSMQDWRKPNPPVVTMPQVRWMWFPPTRDQWTQYDGQWSYTVVSQFGFGIDDAMFRDAIPLEALGTMRIENGRPIYDRPVAPMTPTGVNGQGVGGAKVPWTPGTGERQTTSPTATVIMDVNGQRSVSSGVPIESLPGRGGMVSDQVLQQSLNEARRRIAESQAAALPQTGR